MQEVYEEYPEKDKVTVEFKVMTVDRVREYKMEREYDVLVGRNFTLEELKRQYPTKPVINIPITGYDIVQALYEAKRIYHCRKVGIVGRFFHMYQYEHMEGIARVPITTGSMPSWRTTSTPFSSRSIRGRSRPSLTRQQPSV